MWTARKKRIVFASAAFFIALLVAFYFILAHLVDSQWLKNRAISEINKALGGTVQFEKTSLIIFPRLCLRIQDIKFNRPDTAAGTVKTAEICPRIWTLFRGEFRIASAILDQPDITTAPPAPAEEPFSPETIRTKIIPVIIESSNRSPGSEIKVLNGRLNVQRAEGNSFVFSGINLEAVINREEIYLTLESAASPWGGLMAKGNFPFARDRLGARDLKAAAGGCSISGGEASLAWEDNVPVLSADVNQAGIDLKNLVDWGIFSKLRQGPLKNINSIEGRVNLSSVRLKGPLADPSAWDFSFSGDLDHVALHTAFSPQVVKLDTGRFNAAYDSRTARESAAEVIGISGSIGGSTFENVSAQLKGAGDGTYFRAGADSVSLDIDEIQKWRAFQEFRKKSLPDLVSLKGSARVEKLQAEGPVNSPARWKYELSGRLENIAFALSGAPYAFKVSKGEFRAAGSSSENTLGFAGVSGSFGSSSVSGVAGRFSFDGAARLEMNGGSSRLALRELEDWEPLYERLDPVTSLEGSVTLDYFRFAGALADPATWTYAAAGTARSVVLRTEDFPTSKIDGRFSLDQDKVSLDKARASLLDTDLSLTGQIRLEDNRFCSAALSAAGRIGRETLTWASQYRAIPEYVKVPASISVDDSRLEWKSADEFSLRGSFLPEEGPRIALDLARGPGSWTVRELRLKDEKTDARLTMKTVPGGVDFTYSGSLHKATVDKLVINELEENAHISGNLAGHIPVKDPILASVTGRVTAGDIRIPLKGSAYRLKIDSIDVKAGPDNYQVETAALTWGEQKFTAAGSIARGDGLLNIDLHVLAGQVVYEKLQKMIEDLGSADDQDKSRPSKFWELPLRGKITVSADRFTIKRYASEPFVADIILGKRLVRFEFTKDLICGMPLPGTIDITPEGTSMAFRSTGRDMDLAPVLACFLEKETAASGKFDFTGEATATGDFPESLNGEYTFTARDGMIYRARLISSILEYLNLTRILLGKLPTIGAEGLPYRLVSIKGRIKGTRIEITEFELRGPTVGLAGEGYIDLVSDKVELTVLVSPLRTFDYLISRIPVVRYFFKGILAVPVGVYGTTSNPIIVPLDPSAIGTQLLTIMTRIISAPVKLFEIFK